MTRPPSASLCSDQLSPPVALRKDTRLLRPLVGVALGWASVREPHPSSFEVLKSPVKRGRLVESIEERAAPRRAPRRGEK